MLEFTYLKNFKILSLNTLFSLKAREEPPNENKSNEKMGL